MVFVPSNRKRSRFVPPRNVALLVVMFRKVRLSLPAPKSTITSVVAETYWRMTVSLPLPEVRNKLAEV